jgi:Ion channel
LQTEENIMAWERFRRLRGRLVDPLLTTLTVMTGVLLFVVAPLRVAGAITEYFAAFSLLAVLIIAALTVSGSRWAFWAILISIALILVAIALEWKHPSAYEVYFDALAALIASLTLTIVVTRAVFSPGRITFHRITGAVLIYLNIGAIFVGLFSLVALLVPDAFGGLKQINQDPTIAAMVYFSFTTLTTLGYGDIVPLHPYTRGLANVEAMIGQLYPAILIARLVSLEIEDRRRL